VSHEEKQPLPTLPNATSSAIATKQESDVFTRPLPTPPRASQQPNPPVLPDQSPSEPMTVRPGSPPPPLPVPPPSMNGVDGYSAPTLTTEEQTAVWQKRLECVFSVRLS
jgi:hypothetical protein